MALEESMTETLTVAGKVMLMLAGEITMVGGLDADKSRVMAILGYVL